MSNGGVGRYVALSHCWGTANEKYPMLVTLKSSLEQHGICIPFTSFLKTFQDAIIFTRQLGPKYLWIDCLCIIQDDRDDWARELALMGEIYSNSFVTIAADKAASSYEGLFKNEEDLGKRYYRLEFIDKTGNPCHVYVRQRTGMQPSPTLDMMYCFAGDAKSKLDTRGWTLQERLLSPRIVHFSELEMIWECDTYNVCECGNERGLSNLKVTHRNRRPLDAIDIPYSTLGLNWHDVDREFSGRNLTYIEDRLPAISGLAAAMHANDASDYLAGLWRSSLPSGLLWYSTTNGSSFFGEKSCLIGRRHTAYYAPSWSWASVTGPVSFTTSQLKYTWEILDAHTVRSQSNPFGSVSRGKLKIRGNAAEVRIERRTHINNRTEKEQTRHFAISDGHPIAKKLQEKVVPDVGSDSDETELDANVPFYLLFGAEENGWPFALVLKQVSGQEVYQRVGNVMAERFPWRQRAQVVDERVLEII